MGHSHPKLLQAGLRGALQDTVMQGNLQQHVPSLEVCERLLKLANSRGASLAHCLLFRRAVPWPTKRSRLPSTIVLC